MLLLRVVAPVHRHAVPKSLFTIEPVKQVLQVFLHLEKEASAQTRFPGGRRWFAVEDEKEWECGISACVRRTKFINTANKYTNIISSMV